MPRALGLPQGDVDMTNEAFAHVKINALFTARGWYTLPIHAVRFEVAFERPLALRFRASPPAERARYL